MMKGLVTKIIDNLQVELSNIHLRIEMKEDDEQQSYSLGCTLGKMQFQTTNENWQKSYIDRTLAQNKDKPLYKLLSIQNFGVYYKIKETLFLQDKRTEEILLSFWNDIPLAEQGIIRRYKSDYLLDPVKLVVKLQQFEPNLSVQKLMPQINLDIKLESLGFTLQKEQYINFQKLLELQNDFVRFMNTETLKQKNEDLNQMNQLLKKQGVVEVNKKEVRIVFQQIYTSQLELIIKHGLEDKKQEQLKKELKADLAKIQKEIIYQKILAAIDLSDLQMWAKKVAELQAEQFKKKAEEKKNSGFFSYFTRSSSEQEKPKQELVPASQLNSLQSQFEESVEIEQKLMVQHAQTLAKIPKIQVNFELKTLKIKLEHLDKTSLILFNHSFQLSVKLYDSDNKYHKHALELNLQNQQFGIDVLNQHESIRFLEQKTTSGQGLILQMKTANSANKNSSDLPSSQVNTVDLDLQLKLLPVEVTFQARACEQLIEFFEAPYIKDQTRIALQQQYSGLAKQVDDYTKNLNSELKNNKILIQVVNPCFILPFKQGSTKEIAESESWVFTLGSLSFQTFELGKETNFYEAFELKLQNVAFDYVNQTDLWRVNHQGQSVLNKFDTCVLIKKKRDQSEMSTYAQKQLLSHEKSAQLQISASFSQTLNLSLKSKTFQKLTQISTLVSTQKKADDFNRQQMREIVQKSTQVDPLKYSNFVHMWIQATACLEHPYTLHLFDTANVSKHQRFSLDGIYSTNEVRLEGQELNLTNRMGQNLKLLFTSVKQAKLWQNLVIEAGKELNRIKLNTNEKHHDPACQLDSEEEESSGSEDFKDCIDEDEMDIPEENSVPSVPQHQILSDQKLNRKKTLKQMKKEQDMCPKLSFQFTAPGLQLELITKQKLSNTSNKWQLITSLSDVNIKFLQQNERQDLSLTISSLLIRDNLNDQRFPNIFENKPSSITQDLVSISFTKILPTSNEYQNVDSRIDIEFSGLVAYWKPKCMKYLLQFLSEQKPINDQEENAAPIIFSDQPAQQSSQLSCKQRPEQIVQLNMKLAYLKVVFIHPDNHTYPVVSLNLNQFQLFYAKVYDHDLVNLKVQNLQVYDCMQYQPCSLDPTITYKVEDQIVEREILGLKKNQETDQMLEVKVVLFTLGQQSCCPLQSDQKFNLKLNVKLQKIRIEMVQQFMLRVVDYLSNQVANLVTSQSQSGKEQPLKKVESQEEVLIATAGKEVTKSEFVKQVLNKDLNLHQASQVPFLDIEIGAPLIVLRNTACDKTDFQMDLGTVLIKSDLVKQKGRWINNPDATVLTTIYKIVNLEPKLELVSKEGEPLNIIFKEDKIDVSVELFNPSLIVLPADEVNRRMIQGIPLVFDQSQLDLSTKVSIHLQFFHFSFSQSNLVSFFDMLNSNILYQDQFTDHFKQAFQSTKVEPSLDETSVSNKSEIKYDQKLTSINLVAPSMAIEFRTNDQKLISEICFTALDLQITSFSSGASNLQFSSGLMNILHNEDSANKTKEVMVGHLDTASLVETPQDFYQKLYQDFVQIQKISNEKACFKVVLETKSGGESDMKVEVNKIKLNLKLKVLEELSTFMVKGLERLDSSYLQAKQQSDTVANTGVQSKPKQRIEVNLRDNLLLVENPQVSNSCIACQVSFDILMKSTDKQALEATLTPGKSDNLSEIYMNLTSLSLFFLETNEIYFKGFSLSEKRELLQPLRLTFSQRVSLEKNQAEKTKVLVQVEDVLFKLSMVDLHFFQVIQAKQNEEVMQILNVWNQHFAKKNVLRSEYNPSVQYQIEQKKQTNSNRGEQSVHVEAKKTEVLLINESGGGYQPIIFGQFKNLVMKQKQDLNKQATNVDLQVALSYFKSAMGCFEPLIEKFNCSLTQENIGLHSSTKIKLPKSLNLNITIDLVAQLSNLSNLWAESAQKAEIPSKLSQGLISRLRSTKHASQSLLAVTPQMLNKKVQSSLSNLLSQKSAVDKSKKVPTPYAICNLTDQEIYVYKVNKVEKQIDRNPDVVKPDETCNLVLDKTDTAYFKQLGSHGTQMDFWVRLTFEKAESNGINSLNLNQHNGMLQHRLYNQPNRELYILESSIKNSHRLLTIRTQYIMKNLTQVEYSVRIFHLDQESQKVVTDSDYRMKPGQSIPIVDHVDPKIHSLMKIAIRPSKCRKFSTEFLLTKVKENTFPCETNFVWQHGDTYSILRKKATTVAKAFDLLILPAVKLTNCLPARIKIDIIGVQSTQQQNSDYIKEVTLDKQEVVTLSDVKKTTNELCIKINLGQNFLPAKLNLLPDQSKECDIKLNVQDLKKRNVPIILRVTNQLAGLSVLFYTQNVLICRTIQPLSFNYESNRELPTPIVDEDENHIYIHDKSDQLFCTLRNKGSTAQKLDLITADGLGIIEFNNKKEQFNFAFKSAIWSISNSELLTCKITEVQPQFILCNETQTTLLIQQVDQANQISLPAKERCPYHWSDSSLPKQLRIKAANSKLSQATFSLTQLGSQFIMCESEEGKIFYKVSKRQVSQMVYCLIEQTKAPYVIKNNLDCVVLEISQSDVKCEPLQIQSSKQLEYAWQDSCQTDPMITVRFCTGGQEGTFNNQTGSQQHKLVQLLKDEKAKIELGTHKFSLDGLNEQKEKELMVKGKTIKIQIGTYSEGMQKVIEFSETTCEHFVNQKEWELIQEEESKQGQQEQQVLELEIEKINLSCVNKKLEVLTMQIFDLMLKQTKNKCYTIVEARLSRFQIDNTEENDPIFPVVFKPKCLTPSEEHSHYTLPCEQPLFQFFLHQKHYKDQENVLYFEFIEFLVKEIELKIELNHVVAIGDFALACQKASNKQLTRMSPVFEPKTSGLLDNDAAHFDEEKIKTWRNQNVIIESDTALYIKQYKGSPMLLELTLFKAAQGTHKEKQDNGVLDRLGSLGIKLTSINGAPVQLDALEISNLFGNQVEIQQLLTSYYVQELKSNIFRVAASMDLIGNPYNAVSNLGRGVKNVYYAPRDGFMQGPLQGGFGVIKGIGGLVTTAGGTAVGTVGKVIGSVNKGLRTVTFDQEFIAQKERQEIQEKPSNVIEGVGRGAVGLGKSIYSGVTGVFTKPIEGAQEEGVSGFLVGVGKGALGLVAKPVSGLVGAVSSTAQGLEGTLLNSEDCKLNNTRARLPRPFYTDLSLIKDYNELDALVYNKIIGNSWKCGDFYGAWMCEVYKQSQQSETQSIKSEYQILVLTEKSVLLLSSAEIELKMMCSHSDVKQFVFSTNKKQAPCVQISYMQEKKNQYIECCFSDKTLQQSCQDSYEEIKRNMN